MSKTLSCFGEFTPNGNFVADSIATVEGKRFTPVEILKKALLDGNMVDFEDNNIHKILLPVTLSKKQEDLAERFKQVGVECMSVAKFIETYDISIEHKLPEDRQGIRVPAPNLGKGERE